MITLPLKSSSKRGVFWSFTSAFLWSTTFISARYLLGGNKVDPITLSAVRFLFGGLILLVFGLFIKGHDLFKISLKDAASLAVLGLFGTAGMSVLLFYGQKVTTAINGSLIMQLNPIFILLLSTAAGERIKLKDLAGIFLSLFGCLFVVDVITANGFSYSAGHLKGDLLIVISAICWAVYSVAGKPVVQKLGGYKTTLWAMNFGAIELLILRCFVPAEFVFPGGAVSWSIIIYLAVFPTAIAFFAWYEAMNHIDLQLLNIMQYLTPVFTIFLGWLFLGERLNCMNWLGVFLVMSGVIIIGCKSKEV